jgi:ubiquinone/menaquinone biosynthesis C-methylase UbiE
MSELIKSTFNEICRGYDDKALRFFPRSARSLTRRLRLSGSEHVLDVATGTGHLAFLIAEALPQGRLTAIDFSDGMLECARQKAEGRGIRNIEFLEMDMQKLKFKPSSFDLGVCAFGIFFVEDMIAQLNSITSAVRPGGKVAISTFEENHFFNPLVDMMFNRLQDFGIERPTQTWKQVATEAGCRNLLEEAGLTDICVEYENVGYYLGNADEWWSVVWNGGMRRVVNQLDEEELKRFRSEHLKEIEELRTKSGIWLDVGVLFSIGKKNAGDG